MGAGTSAHGRSAPPSKTPIARDPTQKDDQQQNIVDWDLTYEDALPAGSNLLGNMAFMELYPEVETNSKKTNKKTNTGKGNKGNPENKK